MPAKTYKVKKMTAVQSPPGRVLRIAEEPPPNPPVDDVLITNSTDDEWSLCNAAGPPNGTVTVDTDAAGNRTMSRP